MFGYKLNSADDTIVKRQNKKSSSLEAEILQLEKKKEDLIRKISEIDAKERFMAADEATGYIRNTFFRRIPFEYLNSVFYTECDKLQPLITATLDDYVLNCIKQYQEEVSDEDLVMTFALHCDGYIPSNDGPRLILSDPYKKVFSTPLEKTTDDDVQTWIGRIILADILIHKDTVIDKVVEVKGIKMLKYTKAGIIIDGEEKPIVSKRQYMTYYNDCRGYGACLQAINGIEHTLRSKGAYTKRDEDTDLRIREYDELSNVVMRNDRLEYIYTKLDPLDVYELSIIKAAEGDYLFDFKDINYEKLYE